MVQRLLWKQNVFQKSLKDFWLLRNFASCKKSATDVLKLGHIKGNVNVEMFDDSDFLPVIDPCQPENNYLNNFSIFTLAELFSCFSTSLLIHSCSRDPMILTLGLSKKNNESMFQATYYNSDNHEPGRSHLYIVFFSSCTACDSWECVLEEYRILGTSENEPTIHKA